MGAATIRAYGLEERARRRLRPRRARPVPGAPAGGPLDGAGVHRSVTSFGAVTMVAVARRRRLVGPAWGIDVRRADRLPVPRDPAAEPGERARRGPRPDPDRHRRVAEGPRRARPAGRRGRAGARRRRCRRARWRCRSAGLHFAYRTGPGARRRRPRSSGRRATSRSSARPARARRPSPSCCAVSPTPPPGRRGGRASTCATSPPTPATRPIRLVPQDGFLFDATVGRERRHGPPRRHRRRRRARVRPPRARRWLDRLPAGLDSPVGERGEQLSVGERQLGRAGPGAARRPGPARARRGHQRRRRRDRTPPGRGAGPAGGRAHDGHRRPPAVDGRGRRPGARCSTRPRSSSGGTTHDARLARRRSLRSLYRELAGTGHQAPGSGARYGSRRWPATRGRHWRRLGIKAGQVAIADPCPLLLPSRRPRAVAGAGGPVPALIRRRRRGRSPWRKALSVRGSTPVQVGSLTHVVRRLWKGPPVDSPPVASAPPRRLTGAPMKPVRVAVTGAAGQIGYGLLFRIASGACSAPTSRSSSTCWRSPRPSTLLRAW